MVVLVINKKDYRLKESWNEITIKEAKKLFLVSSEAPENLLYIYKEQAKGSEADNDQVKLKKKSLTQKELDTFYKSVLLCLSDIPKEVIEGINIEDLRVCYDSLLFRFVFGVLHFPLEESETLNSFEWMGTTYIAPKSKKVMGTERPMFNEAAAVYCDASDIDNSSRSLEEGKYSFAELLTAIIFRAKGQDYTEEKAHEVAEMFKDVLTCDIFHSALTHLGITNKTLKELVPNLYQKSKDIKAKTSAKESGLTDFGWLNSFMTLAEMGVFNVAGLTPLESARQTNLYEMMTVLSNMRANSDYQNIYREKQR